VPDIAVSSAFQLQVQIHSKIHSSTTEVFSQQLEKALQTICFQKLTYHMGIEFLQ